MAKDGKGQGRNERRERERKERQRREDKKRQVRKTRGEEKDRRRRG